MKLHRMKLTNFRGVIEREVGFADGITVIEGENEIGKSSIPEALRLLRTTKSSSKREDVKAIQPVGRDVGPEVEAELTVGPHRLIYRKRWIKSPLTELRIIEPKIETVVGDDAHERFTALLSEYADIDLLAALDVQQGSSLDQASLANITTLKHALGGTDVGEADGALENRIEAEFGRHYTATGRPKGRLSEVPNELASHRSLLVSLEDRSRRLIDEVDKSGRLQLDLTRLRAREGEYAVKLREARKAAADLQIVIDRQASLHQLLEVARSELRAADTALGRRRETTQDLVDRSKATEELETEAARLRTLEAELSERFEAAEQQRDEVATELDQFQEKLREDRAALAVARLTERRSELEPVVSRATELVDLLESLQAARDACPVDAKALKRLRDLQQAVEVSMAVASAGAPTVSVAHPPETAVTVNGELVDAQDPYEVPVLEPVQIWIDDLVQVSVSPGSNRSEQQEALDDAQGELDRALKKAGVATLDEATKSADRHGEAAEAISEAELKLASCVGASTLDDLRQELRGIEARLDGVKVDEVPSLEMLQNDVDSADSAERELASRIRTVTKAVDKAREQLTKAREKRIVAETDHSNAVKGRDQISVRLAADRNEKSDEVLAEVVADAHTKLEEVKDQAMSTDDELQLLEPERVQLELENAEGLVDRNERELAKCQAELLKAETLIHEWLGQGLHDEIQNTHASIEELETQLAKVERSANAVQLLRETLKRHRDEAERRYVAPYKERIDRLGRLVFGPSFSVVVSPNLVVEERILDGEAVPFGSLSAGAREQIALLSRLACAELVAEDGGAPVILDDVLGFADPGRLESIGGLLSRAGSTSQIIVLTCQPDRFASIGNAEVVRL